MTKSQSHTLLLSTFLLFIMLGFQNCGKIDQLKEEEGTYHKINEPSVASTPAEDLEFKIEKSLFDFEAEEIQYKISSFDYETISEESNRCYENQMSCHELRGETKHECLKEKTRQFLKCHGYRLKDNDSCILASKSFILKPSQPARVVSVCFDHPYFQQSADHAPPRRALHIGECQSNSAAASWGQAWKSSGQFLNIYQIPFVSPGPKILDLAQETEKLGLTDACGEIQQANFLKLNLEIDVK